MVEPLSLYRLAMQLHLHVVLAMHFLCFDSHVLAHLFGVAFHESMLAVAVLYQINALFFTLQASLNEVAFAARDEFRRLLNELEEVVAAPEYFAMQHILAIATIVDVSTGRLQVDESKCRAGRSSATTVRIKRVTTYVDWASYSYNAL